jgi:phosphoribosylaminoimidazole (AIR) synthetase
MIAAAGPVEAKEMHRVFNMGMGMVVAVAEGVADSVEAWLAERLVGSRRVGFVNDDGHRVTHADSSVVFEHY